MPQFNGNATDASQIVARPAEPHAAEPSQPRHCLRCNERLWGQQASRCSQCGLQYDGRDPATYLAAPMFLRWKFWFPGFCLSVVSGVLSYAICLQSGELGIALFVAVPVSFGAILGYAARIRFWLLACLGLTAVSGVVCALCSLHLAGFFCGMTLGIVFLAPMCAGIVLGFILREILNSYRWDQRWFLPLIALALLPCGVQAVENTFPRRRHVATVKTQLTVHATPRQAWNAIMFYEDVRHEPPWLLRLALPKPIRSVGGKQNVGDIVRCRYDRGYLVKRISRRQPERLLAFDVIEQRLHFERDVTLLGGSFEVEPAGADGSRIVLTTHYARHLHPRWFWQPIERQVIHSLHGHVLEGMRRHALQPPDAEPQYESKPYHDSPPRDRRYALGGAMPLARDKRPNSSVIRSIRQRGDAS